MTDEAETTILALALRWLQQDKSLALATVISTWGSSPCPAGSMLLVDSDGQFQGSVSGGCVESAVIATALECIKADRCEKMHFAVSDDQAWEVGLACGGEIDVWIEPLSADQSAAINLDLLQRLNAATDQSLVLIRDLTNNTATVREPGAAIADAELEQLAGQALESDSCQYLTLADRAVLVQPFNPPLRLLIVGAVHIAQTLVSLAQSCGYAVTVIDPRQSFASGARFPAVSLNTDWPDQALTTLQPDHRTAVVTLTHDPKLDEPALARALQSPAFYVGALGSRKTHAARLQRLTKRGVAKHLLDKIHSPVGLDIQARTPAEIGLAIMAEITCSLRGGGVAKGRS